MKSFQYLWITWLKYFSGKNVGSSRIPNRFSSNFTHEISFPWNKEDFSTLSSFDLFWGYYLSARFQLGNWSAPARLGSARNLHSSARLEPEKSSSGSSLVFTRETNLIEKPKRDPVKGQVLHVLCFIAAKSKATHQLFFSCQYHPRIDFTK